MGIIGSAFVGYNRVFGAGDNRNIVDDFILESLFYYDLSNSNSYTLGDTTASDLSSNNYTLTNLAGSNFTFGSDGDIVFISNNTWNVLPPRTSTTLPDAPIVEGVFTDSGISMNFWVKPQYGKSENSPPFDVQTFIQPLFSAYDGGITPWSFGLKCSDTGIQDTIVLRLGYRSDQNNQVDTFEYNYGLAPSDFSSKWRMLSYTWTNGESYAMYLDGVKIKSGSTSKSWDSGALYVNDSSFLLGGGDANQGDVNVSEVSSGFAIDRVLTDNQISTYYDQTKAFYNR